MYSVHLGLPFEDFWRHTPQKQTNIKDEPKCVIFVLHQSNHLLIAKYFFKSVPPLSQKFVKYPIILCAMNVSSKKVTRDWSEKKICLSNRCQKFAKEVTSSGFFESFSIQYSAKFTSPFKLSSKVVVDKVPDKYFSIDIENTRWNPNY